MGIATKKAGLVPEVLRDMWSPVARRLGLEDVFAGFALDAPKRDVERRLLFPEIAEIKRLRLGAVRLPRERGGLGLTVPEVFHLGRDMAIADSNLPHVLRNHFNSVERHLRTVDHPFSDKVLRLAAEGAIFGGAHTETGGAPAGVATGGDTTLTKTARSYVLNGVKAYSTGNLYADYIFASVSWADSSRMVQVLVPTDRKGISIEDDWEGFGQKLTASGSTVFRDVEIFENEILPDELVSSRDDGFYNFTFQQLFLTTVISGILWRILADAIVLVKTRGRNFYHGLEDHPVDEPAIHGVIGQIAAQTHAVSAFVDRAIDQLDISLTRRTEPEGKQLSLNATIAAAEAKVVAEDAGTRLSSALIDLASGSSVSFERALDRHWRNFKVISSHNPRIYKERLLGDYYLHGTAFPTGPFF